MGPEEVFKKSGEESGAELEMLKLALDASAIVAFTDRAGTITHVNDNFCAISGFSREELLGKNHRIINSGFHPREYFREMWKRVASGKVWRGEICNRSKSGKLYWVDTTIVPFGARGPYGSTYAAIRFDITERKRLEWELEAERARLAISDKLTALGELSAGIAHELGNPIGTIRGRMEMLKILADREPERLVGHVEKAAETVFALTDRMTSILKNMRAMSRDGSNDPFQPASVKALLDATVELGEQRYRKRGIQVSIAPYDDMIRVRCRETQIIQVLVNLINNACDAIENLPERWIRFDVSQDGKFARIAVTDSGRGVPAEARSRLFRPFFSTKGGQGTGLGLHLARTIAEQHGGHLELEESALNTRFVLRLPLWGDP